MEREERGRWTAAVAEQARKFDRLEDAAAAMGASYSSLNRWLQGLFTQRPGEDKQARVAALRGESLIEFQAWLKGGVYTPGAEAPPEEVAQKIEGDQEYQERVLEAMSSPGLIRLSVCSTEKVGERLRKEKGS